MSAQIILPVVPNYYLPSQKILELSNNNTQAFSKLDFSYEYPKTETFVDVAKSMVESGNIFKYEDFDYIQNGIQKNNLENTKVLYSKTDKGYHYNRIERLATGHNVSFRVYNQKVGWFPEVKEAFPDLVKVCEDFIKKFDVKVWNIVIGCMSVDLDWHMDLDGYYGFRLHMSDNPFELAFREIKPEWQEKFVDMTLKGHWKEVTELTPEHTFEKEYVITQEVGQAFIFNNLHYVHKLRNKHPQLFLFIKGIV